MSKKRKQNEPEKEEIGKTAGAIWNALNTRSEQSLKDLRKAVKGKEPTFGQQEPRPEPMPEPEPEPRPEPGPGPTPVPTVEPSSDVSGTAEDANSEPHSAVTVG